MAKISDEIRDWCEIRAGNGCAFVDKDDCDKLSAIADRIDKEMVELPRDIDGVPINLGDTMYLEDGRKAEVTCIDIRRGENGIDFLVCGKDFSRAPESLTHTYPYSWESIANELEAAKGWRDQYGDYNCLVSSVSTKTLGDWADRIRKLAKEQGNE